MVATKEQAIGLAVLSFLTIGCGIAVIVLFKFAFDDIQSSSGNLPLISAFWVYGLPILVTGALGILAAFLRNNVSVGIFMAVCIICLIVVGAFTVMAALVLFTLDLADSSCYRNSDGACICYNSRSTSGLYGSNTPLSGESCNILVYSRASCALIIVSWLLMLAGSIVSCMACCCGKREQSQAGVIFAAHPSAPPAGGYEMQYQPGAPHPTAGQPYPGTQPYPQNDYSKAYP